MKSANQTDASRSHPSFAAMALGFALLGVACQRSPATPGPRASVTSTSDSVPAPFAAPPVLAGTPDIPALVTRVRPVVVNISVEEVVSFPHLEFEWPYDFFTLPHGRRGGETEPRYRRQAQGSGFIIDAKGIVVTNSHVVEGASTVRVRLADDREFKAKVKGQDSRLDLAVLQLEAAKDLPVASLGSAEDLKVGEYVVAVGNPFGLGHTVTMGIVSAKSRTIGVGPYDDFIQTDAAINPGNSGGPLFNLRGQVVGINAAINPQGRGIGFAIPVDALREVLPQLLAAGRVERGRLGVYVQPLTWPLARALGLEKPRGALVSEVEKGGPADRAGVTSGDVITAVQDTPIERVEEVPRAVAKHAPGTTIRITIFRDKREKTVEATLDKLKTTEAPVLPQKTSLGRYGIDVTDGKGGALVRRVSPEASAVHELEVGDVIVAVSGATVASAKDAERLLAGPPPLLLRIRRNDAFRFVVLEPN